MATIFPLSLVTIKLERAFLCLDCEGVGDCSELCPSCGSKAVYPLAKFINRTGLNKSVHAV
jgi:hypothetical protein